MVDTTAGEKFVTVDQLDENAEEVYKWSMSEYKKEVERLESQGVSPIDIQIMDMSVLVQGKKLQLNRVVFNTELDFNQVQ